MPNKACCWRIFEETENLKRMLHIARRIVWLNETTLNIFWKNYFTIAISIWRHVFLTDFKKGDFQFDCIFFLCMLPQTRLFELIFIILSYFKGCAFCVVQFCPVNVVFFLLFFFFINVRTIKYVCVCVYVYNVVINLHISFNVV